MTTSDSSLIGKTGRVTGRVGPNTTGEVVVSIRGGSEAYLAHPYDGKEVIEKGAQVVIIEVSPARTLFVSRFNIP